MLYCLQSPLLGWCPCNAATEIHPDVAIVMLLVRWPAAFFAGLVHSCIWNITVVTFCRSEPSAILEPISCQMVNHFIYNLHALLCIRSSKPSDPLSQAL